MEATERPAAPLAAASCHTQAQLEHAVALGLDFAVVGPVKPTASHPGAQPLGWPRFSALVSGCAIPVYAIGGLAAEDLDEAMRAGAHGVAMIGAAWRDRRHG
jgi:8-oxo-dGTP diphosphatase